MITVIRNYSVNDITSSIKYLLDKASKSEEVRQLAIEIIADKGDPISAVYDWVKGNMNYVPDPVQAGDDIELFISPVRLVKNYRASMTIAGDCDDMAIFCTSLCRAIGIRSNVIIIDSVGSGLDHAFCEAWSDKLNNFISVDPSSDYPLGWSLPYKSRIIIS